MRHQMTGDVMTTDVVRAVAGTPFKEVAALLAEHRISGLPVVDDDDKVIGVVSETDLLLSQADNAGSTPRPRHLHVTRTARTAAAKSGALTAGELMTTPPVTVHAQEVIAVAARTMARHRVERLPVLDEEDRLVGIVTRGDLLQVFLRPDTDIRAEVIDEILVRTLWLAPHAIGVTVADGVVTLDGRLERRSDVSIAVHMVGLIDGVVAVVDHLTHRQDDTHLRPAGAAVHGIADGRLHKA